MPNVLITKISKKTGRSKDELEVLWNKAKEIVRANYKISEADRDFYVLTMGVFKKMLHCKEGEDSSCLYEQVNSKKRKILVKSIRGK